MSGLKSLVHCFWTFVCLAVLGAVAVPAGAQELWSGYFVDNIETKAVAGTGAEAQEMAFRNARVAGLREVASRMVCEENQSLLRIPSDVELQAMVQSTELSDQKIIGNSYSGLLNIVFDPSKVKNYFARQQAPYAAEPAGTQLAFPILRIDGGPAQIFDQNPWFQIWANGPNRALLQSYDVPDGDEEDRNIFDPELPSRAAALAMLEKYGFTGGLVVNAQVLNGIDGQPESVDVEAIRIGEGFGEIRLNASVAAEEGDTLEVLLRRAASDIQEKTSAAYCNTIKTAVEQVFNINVVVIGTDIAGWVQAEDFLRVDERIKTISLIGQREGAIDVSLEFSGTLLDLQSVFRSARFRFEAYTTQQAQSDAIQVFFFAQPDFQQLPRNVRILQLSEIQLAN